MKKQKKKLVFIASVFLIMFTVFTALVKIIDVAPSGPQNSFVGFSKVNLYVHNVLSENMFLYEITDCLSVIPLGFVVLFFLIGVFQWIKRKNLLKVDKNILVLGLFYLVVVALFIVFEVFVINYRPVLIDGVLEASYPSSTTLLVMFIVPTAIIQFNLYIKNKVLRKSVEVILIVFATFMVNARLVSGVHWLTDIVGGILLGTGLVFMYSAIISNK